MILPKPAKMKSGAYRMRLQLGGKSVMVYGETEAQCRKQATLIKSEHLSGKVVQGKCRYTVSQAIDKYIADKPKLSPATVRGYKSIQRNMFQDAMPLMADSVNWQAVINADEHGAKTIKNSWGFIVSVLKHIGITAPNVSLPQTVNSERPFLQPEQIPTFIEALRDQTCEIAALLGLHSLRRSEILDMTYGDVDLKNGKLYVRGAAVMDENSKIVHKAENKNSASRREVPIMIPRLTELLKAESKQHKQTDYIVTTHPSTLYHQVNAVCKRNNLPEIGVHGLRHSAVSLAYHLGWSELTSMKIFGYADYNTMRKIYTHLADADKKKNVSDMEKFFSQKIKKAASKTRNPVKNAAETQSAEFPI